MNENRLWKYILLLFLEIHIKSHKNVQTFGPTSTYGILTLSE